MCEQRARFAAAEEEYCAGRDHRTNIYQGMAGEYAERSVLVTADSVILSSLAGQVAFLVTCNLLARWCRQVAVVVENVELHARFRMGGSLLELVLDTMLDADP